MEALREPSELVFDTELGSLDDSVSRLCLSDPVSFHELTSQLASDGLPSESNGLLNRPEASNLVNIFSALTDLSIEQTLNQFGGSNFSTFKNILAEIAVEQLSGISSEMSHLMKDPEEIDRILGREANRAKKIATPILKKTYDIIGMVR